MDNNYVPEKINSYNAYIDGNKGVGVASSTDLPDLNMKTGEIKGLGISGTLDSPTIGQWEKFEQVIEFNTIYSSMTGMLSPNRYVDLTFRAAQQVYNKTGGYNFKGLRIVERGRVKAIKLGKLEAGEMTGTQITLEVTYILVENDGQPLVEIDKLNSVYKVKGQDMLSEINALI